MRGLSFSILERIDVGETRRSPLRPAWNATFSILERIDVGETQECALAHARACRAFSILERIDVGETLPLWRHRRRAGDLSVSSNGSTWVKRRPGSRGESKRQPFSILERIDVGETCADDVAAWLATHFQYPRTDRRG